MSKVLDGITVIEQGTFITGPAAAMLLADLGANVIKVEQPGTGDPFRAFKGGLYSPHYQTYNRNKRSIELDAKNPEKRIAFLHATQPSSVDSRLRYTGTRQPWESVYVSVADASVCDEGGFDYLPYSVARWQKDAGSPYANGCPSMNALPEARMLNMMSYTVLRAGQKAMELRDARKSIGWPEIAAICNVTPPQGLSASR